MVAGWGSDNPTKKLKKVQVRLIEPSRCARNVIGTRLENLRPDIFCVTYLDVEGGYAHDALHEVSNRVCC